MDFRPEALARREDAWDGHVRLTNPLPVRLVSAASALLVAGAIALLCLGTYTRRVHAEGRMLPADGLLRVEAPGAGVVTFQGAREGERVHTGQTLYEIDVDPASPDGQSQAAVLAQMERQSAMLDEQRVADARDAIARKTSLEDQLAIQTRQQAQIQQELAIQAPLLDLSRASWARVAQAFAQRLATNSVLQDGNIGYAQLLTTHAQFLQSAFTIDDRVVKLRSDLRVFDDETASRLLGVDKE